MDFSNEELAIIISGVSVFVAIISVIVSIIYNVQGQKQYNRSLEPAISFKLVDYSGMLYLHVENTGKSAAFDIKINIRKLENNGGQETIHKDAIFENEFELYAGEKTQGMIGYLGETYSEHCFPKVTLEVTYRKHISRKKVMLTRTVVFCPAYNEKIYADVKMDLHSIEKNIENIAKSNLRTANYLDGCQVTPFDELNIIANRSLHDDILDVRKKDAESNIKNRKTVIEEAMFKVADCFKKRRTK